MTSLFDQEAGKANGQLSLSLQGGGKMGQRTSELAVNPTQLHDSVADAQAPGIIETIECDLSAVPPSYRSIRLPMPESVDTTEGSPTLRPNPHESPPRT
jgi:hypothetical protein